MTKKQLQAMREGFEAQRRAGINVDWFTWQIAWHDAIESLELERASQPGSGEDTARLDWLLRFMSGAEIRRLVGPLQWTGDDTEFRAAIDAARASLDGRREES